MTTAKARDLVRRAYPFGMGLVVGVMVAGLVVPFAVGDSEEPATSTFVGGTGADTGGSGAGGSLGEDGFEGDGGAGLDGGSGLTSGGDAVAGGTGGTGATGATGATGRRGATAPAGGSGGTGGSGGDGPAPGGGGGGGTGLTATDRGVTAESIRVGALLLDIGSLGRVGVGVPGVDPAEQQEAFQALFDEINERGGINGRMIEPVYRQYDVFNQDDMRAACLALTQDAQVFTVLDAGGYMPVHVLCVTDENDTPMVMTGSTGMPVGWYQLARQQLFTTFFGGERQMAVWADELDRLNHLQGKKLGIVHDGRPGQKETIDVLQRNLEAAGHDVVHVSRFASDFGAAASQVPVEVQQMRAAGAELVFLTANTLVSTQFAQGADNQGYHPEYVTSDWQNMSTDTGAQNMPPSFEGSLSITTVRTGEWRVGAPEAPNDVPCRELYEARVGKEMSRQDQGSANKYGLITKICAVTRIFEAGAKAAGPGITRRGFAQATANLGPIRIPDLPIASLAPGKFDAADAVRTLSWKGDCRCWLPVDDFRKVRR